MQQAQPAANNGVQVNRVVKSYGARAILNEISLNIPAGETTVILGPSGCGKSTLLRCINGLNTFDAGMITVGEHRLTPQRDDDTLEKVRRTFGMIFQDFQLFPHLTAVQNVMEAPMQVLRTPAQEARDLAEHLLSRVGLAERAEHYPRQLSGGQKQRVAIARALAMQPRGLLCDEITSALDPELKQDVLNVIESLQEQDGMTIVMVTHEIGFARRAGDRVIVLAEGRVVEEGVARQVIDSPATERAQKFLKYAMS